MSKPKPKILHEWKSPYDNRPRRLLSVPFRTPGYEDQLAIERQDSDLMGEPQWVVEHKWEPSLSATDTRDRLVEALKDLRRSLDETRAPKLPVYTSTVGRQD